MNIDIFHFSFIKKGCKNSPFKIKLLLPAFLQCDKSKYAADGIDHRATDNAEHYVEYIHSAALSLSCTESKYTADDGEHGNDIEDDRVDSEEHLNKSGKFFGTHAYVAHRGGDDAFSYALGNIRRKERQ